MSSERPLIKLIPAGLDLFLDRLAWMGILFIWIYTIIHYSQLPDTIPSQYNFKGEADNYGTKKIMWILPGILTVLVIGLTILNRYPQVFNYPVKITEENALRQYTMATRLIRFLKLTIVVLIIFVDIKMTKSVHDNQSNLGSWFLPAFIAGIFILLMIYLYEAAIKKK
ncbi:MAG TPA: DUF1648 domain-containing protein [Puia sp.]|nr:DUF1648 domain-containing protein [Puia sp.]